jgi:hypothetical protein
MQRVDLSTIDLDQYVVRAIGTRGELDAWITQAVADFAAGTQAVACYFKAGLGAKLAAKFADAGQSVLVENIGTQASKTISRTLKSGKVVSFDRNVWQTRDFIRVTNLGTVAVETDEQ